MDYAKLMYILEKIRFHQKKGSSYYIGDVDEVVYLEKLKEDRMVERFMYPKKANAWRAT